MIVVNNNRNLFNYNYYLDEDRQIRFRLNTEATYDFEKTMNVIIEKLKFVKLPIDKETGKEQKEFEEMLGHIYIAYYSEYGKGYVIVATNSEEASRAFDNTIYKTLIAAGEDKEFARACAYEGEDSGMCLYIPKECFERVKE